MSGATPRDKSLYQSMHMYHCELIESIEFARSHCQIGGES